MILKKLTPRQCLLAEKLLDKYEESATYRGTNKISQTFSVPVTAIYPAYLSDYTDVRDAALFEEEMEAMEEAGLVRLTRRNGEIRKLTAQANAWGQLYALTGRQERRVKEDEQRAFYRTWLSKAGGLYGQGEELSERSDDSDGYSCDFRIRQIITAFCRAQIQRIEGGKKANLPAGEAARVLDCLWFLGKNRGEVLERELSISVLKDSKAFEKSVRGRVCRLLEQSGFFDALLTDADTRREREQILLAELGVFSNPSWLYVKGKGRILFKDGREIVLMPGQALGFPAGALADWEQIIISDGTVMTVENLTSFNRVERENTFFVYLAGYHTTARQKLLLKIAEDNPDLTWMHFGDLDPDGFYIAEHLRSGTGLPFALYKMDVPTLEYYAAYTRPLEDQDRRKAESLIQAGKYMDVMAYMLRTGRKLEQEIISWQEANGITTIV